MSELGNHLWQSTLFAAAVAAACFALKKNRARTRYWLWLAASAKFLVPFSLLVSLGGRLAVPASTPLLPDVLATQVEQLSVTFAPVPVVRAAPPSTSAARRWPEALGAVWLGGMLLVTATWVRRWRGLRAIRRQARPAGIEFAIPVVVSAAALEPGVFGFVRPVLLLPEGLMEKLAPEQFETVLAHELCHVKSRDNLTAALHLAVATIFWFHPAVWWIGRRLIEERERACDEAVLSQGNRPEAYAQGILSICKFYRELPLACAAGVTGADLKKRIREIMTRRVSYRLTPARKTLLAAAGALAVMTPVLIGILRAQTLPPAPVYGYEVASIRPSTPGETASHLGPGPQGGLKTQNTSTMQLLTFAYDVRSYQFLNVPAWVQSEKYDVNLTPDKPEAPMTRGMSKEQMDHLVSRHRQQLQSVLRDRFGLVLRAETREMPIYALTVAKGGHKLGAPKDPGAPPNMSTNRQEMTAASAYMKMLTDSLSNLLSRPVRNETGLDGPFDFHMTWTADARVQLLGKIPKPGEPVDADAEGGTSIFSALPQQLGLALEGKKGPVPVYVVEKIERPSAN